MELQSGVDIMIREAKRDLALDGGTRQKNQVEKICKEQLKIGSGGRIWERPMFSSALIKADDDDDDDEEQKKQSL